MGNLILLPVAYALETCGEESCSALAPAIIWMPIKDSNNKSNNNDEQWCNPKANEENVTVLAPEARESMR